MTRSDQKDILLEVYKNNTEHLRHHENQRSVITTIVAGIAGAILGFLADQGSGLLPLHRQGIGVFVVALGLFGLAATLVHGARISLHQHRIDWIRAQLNEMFALPSRREDVPAQTLSYVRLKWVWATFHIIITAIGVVIIAVP